MKIESHGKFEMKLFLLFNGKREVKFFILI